MKAIPSVLGAVIALFPLAASAYTGSENAEATLTFESAIRLDANRAPNADEAKKEIALQVKHLFGGMTNARVPAVPKNDYQIEILSTLPVREKTETYEVAFRYTGTVAAAIGISLHPTLYLPTHPRTIATDAVSVNDPSTPAACTDASEAEPEYFWYFWSPEREGCRLVEGRDYLRVNANLVWKNFPSAEMRSTYPEYDRLVQIRDGKKIIPLSVLIGKFDGSASGRPLKSSDSGATQFQSMRNEMLKLGFTESSISKRDMKAIMKAGKKDGEIRRGRLISGYPFALLFSKVTPAGTIEVRLFYGDSSDTGSSAFFVLYQDALKNDALMIYDGHSGLGDYLSLENLKNQRGMTPRSNPSIYQIFFFNSCTSYAYYNDSYFRWKASPADPQGTKQLDILTNGLATGYTTRDTNMVLVKAIHRWAESGTRESYASITDKLSLQNLIGVNGDEDNSTAE
jgi:hypothetical protein